MSDPFSHLSSEFDLSQHKSEILSEFACQNSGNCCRATGYVYVTEPEIVQMAERLELSVSDFCEQYVRRRNGWPLVASPDHRPHCFLDTANRCQVYNERPPACRSYPDWPEVWDSHETVLSEISACPGLKKAAEKLVEKLY